jgi:tetratricopeptide (TPR) repeat protein
MFAAKTFKDELFARDIGVAREFEREARTWIDLAPHENVARAYFVETIEGKPFVFLEYISGGDLLAAIAAGRFDSNMQELLVFAIQICDGMNHVLSHGISAHRDLKPNNCLITSEQTIKVTDFGIAMATGLADAVMPAAAGQARRVVGTLPYIAPEQWVSPSAVDVRTDVYAFGITLYQMITKRLPFVIDPQAKSPAQIADSYEALHRTAPVPAFECAVDGLKDVVMTCLAKAAAARYPDFSAIRAALTPIYEAIAGTAIWRPATPPEIDASIWSERGASLSKLGYHNEAVSACRQAIAMNGGSTAAWNNLGVALINWGAQEKNFGYPDEALRLYREAVDACETAIALNPRLAEPSSNLGLALGNLGLSDQALANYDRALDLGGKHVGTLGNKVNLLLQLGRSGEAQVSAEQAVRADPNSASAWFSLGLVYDFQGRLQEAINGYSRATAVNPFLPDAWGNLAAAHLSRGSWPDAVASATRALAINPDHRIALSNRAYALTAVNRPGDALTDLERALQLYPKDPILHLNRARPLAMLGRRNEALDACDQAIALNRRSGTAFIQKGAIYEELGDRQSALECYEQARGVDDPRAEQRIARLRRLIH